MPNSKPNLKRFLLIPWGFLFMGLALTYGLQDSARESARKALHDEFDFRVNEVIETIRRRMQNYEQILEGVVGLYAASESVTHEEFVEYVRALQLEGKYQGIQGVGFAQHVLPHDKQKHIQKIRSSGDPAYDIRPAGKRTVYAPSVYLMPETWRNRRAMGFDMYADPEQRAAMEKARDENSTSLTGRVKLVQETEQDVQPGFLMYLPIYRQQVPHQTVEERRANLLGWAYAPFRVNDFMAGIMGKRFDEVSDNLDFELYSSAEPAESTAMFDSIRGHAADPSAEFYVIKRISFYGHPAAAVVTGMPEFSARLKSDKADIIAAAGSVASVLLALVAWLLVTGRARAQEFAEEMTVELRQSAAVQQRLNRALHLISECNVAMVQADDEHKLMAEVCRLCVEHGGYLMAWVGYAEDDAEKTVRPIAQSGYEQGYLDGVSISWSDENEHGRGPTGTAIRTGVSCVNPDVLTNPTLALWRDAAIQRGYRSSISVPMIGNAKVLGALTMYAREVNAFDAEEIKLLEELASDLAYGIFALRTRAAHEAAKEKLDFLSNFDPLTHLPNRPLLRDRFEHAVLVAAHEKSTLTMLYLDLDNFQQINDALGHNVGDQVLVAAVERLRQCIPATDTISRLSGDAFVVLLEGHYDTAGLAGIANHVREVFAEPINMDGNVLNIAFSIGISQFPSDGNDFDTLLKHADTALNNAKEAGRNTYRFFTHAMNADFAEQIRLTGGLLNALRNQEFRLYYQPQIDLHSGRIIGAEALIRWQHPVDGLISPARFIPLAERSGHIVEMSEWVINEACRQGKRWMDANTPLAVAVNLSALQFKHGNVLTMVRNVLARTGLPPELLELELTESILLQDIDATMQILRELKALGVKLSIDDFGTGYSSLAYLKRLAVDKLKIDQSFVRDMLTDEDGASIVQAIIQLGHTLQLEVIAEGVETDAQRASLATFGCDQGQGYLFSRPVPADQFALLIK